MIRFWLDKLKALYERVPGMTSLTAVGKILLMIAISALAVGLIVVFGSAVDGCRATIPVVIHNVNQTCSSEIHNQDGTVDYQGCKADGQQPVEAGGSPGNENITVPKPDSSLLLGLEPPSAMVTMRN